MSKRDSAEVSKQPTNSRKKNALTHGIYGKDILLPWESREEFEKLLAELQDEFQPSGRMENEIVFDVAHLRWQKYRVHQMWIAAAYGDPFVSDLIEAGQKSWAGMRKHLKCEAKDRRMITVMEDKLFLERTAEAAEMLVELIQTGKLGDSATKTSVTRSREANALVNVISEVFSRKWWLSLRGMPKKASFSASESARIRLTNEIS